MTVRGIKVAAVGWTTHVLVLVIALRDQAVVGLLDQVVHNADEAAFHVHAQPTSIVSVPKKVVGL